MSHPSTTQETAMNPTTPETVSPAPDAPRTRPLPPPRHGVDTPTLLSTINAVGGQPELARFRFRASNRWLAGTHSRSKMESFFGAGGWHSHVDDREYDADHPAVLIGADRGPTPVEFLLHALAACLTAGIANIAAARGVTLTEVESTVEGDIDLLGIFGLSREVRNGYQSIRASFRIRGDASETKLREIVDQSRARSAVFDVLSNGVPIAIDVDAA
jgi:uncharacterized OsmC-like protein